LSGPKSVRLRIELARDNSVRRPVTHREGGVAQSARSRCPNAREIGRADARSRRSERGRTDRHASRPSTKQGVRSSTLAIVLAVLLASCGGSDEAPGAPSPRASPALNLRVTVAPEGPGGPQRVRRIECQKLGEENVILRCRTLAGLEPQDLDAVPGRTACTQIYGGPATARVSGTLRGAGVSASFDLTDGCEMERWRRNAALLGPPRGPGVTPP
jgi:hypothetical protein